MTQILLSYTAGLVVLLNPCVLPVLPIILGSALGESRYGPAALAAGLVMSFCLFGFLILSVGYQIGLDPALVRDSAAALLIAIGLLLLLPKAQAVFATALAPLADGANRMLGRLSGQGLSGQFAIGLLLGLVWSPCVGPVLGVAIASASQGENLASAFGIFLIFGLGVATTLMLFAYGTRKLLAGHRSAMQGIAKWAKPVFGGLLIIVGGLIISGLDKKLEAAALAIMPEWLIAFTVGF